ncbi:hypothetical protein H4582DRAFT_1997755 [Lactarius indigo]|nr:hypothetical protein H4582DRAFT_1997755 [Lactarius indigo]
MIFILVQVVARVVQSCQSKEAISAAEDLCSLDIMHKCRLYIRDRVPVAAPGAEVFPIDLTKMVWQSSLERPAGVSLQNSENIWKCRGARLRDYLRNFPVSADDILVLVCELTARPSFKQKDGVLSVGLLGRQIAIDHRSISRWAYRPTPMFNGTHGLQRRRETLVPGIV